MKIIEEHQKHDIFLDIRLTPQELQNLKEYVLITNSFKIGQYTFNIGLAREVNNLDEYEDFDRIKYLT
jgi:hypothetical protein